MSTKAPRSQATTGQHNQARKRRRPTPSDKPAKSRKRQLVDRALPTSIAQSLKTQAHTAPPHSAHSLQIYVCGSGEFGELGLGAGKKVTNVKVLRLNPNLHNVTELSTGGMHAAALTSDGCLLTWGVNDGGALGRDTQWEGKLRDIDEKSGSGSDSDSDDGADLNSKEATPLEVDHVNFIPDTTLTHVAAGDSSTFVSTANGQVYGWGIFRDHNGDYGFTVDSVSQKGDKAQRKPVLIPGLKDIVQISCGADYALALNSSGQVFAWGCGQQCELGRRLVERHRSKALLPARVEIPKKYKIRSIHAATNHAFAIDQDGNTWAWGSNNFGQTGVSKNVGQEAAVVSVPTRVESLIGKNMAMIAGGLHHSIGLTKAGECLVWGRLDGGQLGFDVQALAQQHPENLLLDTRGKPRCLLEPTALPIPQSQYVAAGSDHCLAVTSEGRPYAWGFNATFQCGQPNDDEDVTIATLMAGKAIKEVNVVWAGAGGQYSMVATTANDAGKNHRNPL